MDPYEKIQNLGNNSETPPDEDGPLPAEAIAVRKHIRAQLWYTFEGLLSGAVISGIVQYNDNNIDPKNIMILTAISIFCSLFGNNFTHYRKLGKLSKNIEEDTTRNTIKPAK
jgi:hypothetical protein